MDERFLDFGAGSCWISEFIARMGKKVVAFDIHDNLNGCVTSRLAADKRINPSLVSFKRGDGHCMPFLSESFGHILCYDTLHHMYHAYRVDTYSPLC